MENGGRVIGPGRVAVVTGAASGIGLALCGRFAGEGMRIVMADIEEPALTEAAAGLASTGAEVLAVRTDVSRFEEVAALRDRAVARFGAVHLLCNNAGVGGPGRQLWEMTQADWEWVLGVNLWGVINGVRAFVPHLLEQDAAHVVNTASIAGLIAGSLGAYSVTKHAVVALSESLQLQLRGQGSSMGVSVLCPGLVRTNIFDSTRNRPPGVAPPPDAVRTALQEVIRQGAGMDPAEVAQAVAGAVRSGRFYVLTHPEMNEVIRQRAESVIEGSLPVPTFG